MVPSAALGLFLILPFDSQLLRSTSCLSASFYGNYRDGQVLRSVFSFNHGQMDCYSRSLNIIDLDVYKVETQHEPQQLVWLEAQEVDPSLTPLDTFNPRDWISSILGHAGFATQSYIDTQEPFQRTADPFVVWQSGNATLVSIDLRLARVLDQHLPRFWKSTLLPSAPTAYHPVLTSSTKYIQDIVSQIGFDPLIASTVNNISVPQIASDIGFLTGEDPESTIATRHSFTPGARKAAAWLKAQFEETGAKCELKPFLDGSAPNVICRYAAVGETDSIVILGAHYDSRGSFGLVRAPGANDDGSGITSLLSIARIIARKGIKFQSNVELCAFAGEEQGLLGSRAYAKQLKQEGANVVLMIQADMLAYHAYQEPPQLGIPDLIGSPVATQLVTKLAAVYSPELQVGFTPVCCSDHQSFHEQGYVATHVFERAGPIMDPMYHNSGDLSEREGYDLDQVRSIAKVQFAALLHTAGYEMA